MFSRVLYGQVFLVLSSLYILVSAHGSPHIATEDFGPRGSDGSKSGGPGRLK